MKRRVSLSLDADLLVRADAQASELGQSRTTFVERALRLALEITERDRYPLQRVGPERSRKPPAEVRQEERIKEVANRRATDGS